MTRIGIDDFIEQARKKVMIDVRSPKEFLAGHLPGAINIPVLNNEEREKIGTIYKQKGRMPAIQKGLELVGPRANDLAKEALSVATNKQLLVYCWRGGMRSQKMATLFETVGIDCTVLEGGYKAYRNQLLTDFGKLDSLLLLRGATGSGKTDILHELEKMGEQIIDLEGIANHRGSAFGSLGLGEQPATKHFQNLLYQKLLQLDLSKRIWIESESMSIGKVYLPEPLWKAMNQAPTFELMMDAKWRVKRLMKVYGGFSKEEISSRIVGIQNRFGGNRVAEALELVKAGEAAAVTKMLLDYYDAMYAHSCKKYKERKPILVICEDGDAKKNARILLSFADGKKEVVNRPVFKN